MTFDPTIGRRIAPAWSALLDLLADGDWHRRDECIDRMLAGSDLKVKTCSNVLRYAVRDGLVQQFGDWHGPGDDRRFIRRRYNPDELVSCKRCFGPTTAAVAKAHDGLCAACYRTTGQEPR